MFDQEFVKYLATLGVGGVLAAGMFYFYRMDAISTRESLSRIVQDNSAAFREHTVSNTRLVTLMETIHAELSLRQRSS